MASLPQLADVTHCPPYTHAGQAFRGLVQLEPFPFTHTGQAISGFLLQILALDMTSPTLHLSLFIHTHRPSLASWNGWPWSWTSIVEKSLYSGIVGKAVRVEEGGTPDSLVGPEHVRR